MSRRGNRLLGTEAVSVQHRSQARVGGNLVVSPDGAAFPVVASIQPAPGTVLAQLPENARVSSAYLMFVENDPGIRTTDVAGYTPADVVTRTNGKAYEVVSEVDWTGHQSGIPHHVYLLREIGGDEQ